MLYSKLFPKTLKQSPSGAESVNHQLLVRGGFVDQLMAGVYSYLPLGLRVLRNIEEIVREEMNVIGGQEVLLPVLHPSEIWKTTGGWEKIDILFKIKSRTGKDYALGQSEEEVVTPLVLSRINTYKDLPLSVYQIHWKFRDELRAKSGILRGREFLMKDMYSFHENQEDFLKFYEVVKEAYKKIYSRLGLTAKVTEASGGSFSEKISYEFMVLTEAGEDEILYCSSCDYCVNVEIAKVKEGGNCPKCGKSKLEKATASEVGNVFDLGQKYGKDFNLTFLNREGKKEYPVMGCYGFGLTRVMGVIVEKCSDEKGIIWPEAVAPFKAHLMKIQNSNVKTQNESSKVKTETEKVYDQLKKAGIEVLYDDREEVSVGEKFADADLIGIPYRVVVSEKTLEQNSVEVKKRSEKEANLLKVTQILDLLG